MPEVHPAGGMAVIPGIDALTPDLGPLFVVVGVFDGLHLGHQYLLEHLVAGAVHRRARPAVVTFDSHPDEVLTGKAPPLLCDTAERLERLEAAGVEVTVVQHFDADLRMNTFEQFIRRIAAGAPIAGFLMTPDSAFGNERRGTPAAVAELGTAMGYGVEVVPALDLDGRPVRSADIRTAIGDGRLDQAAELLGRPYAVVGTAHHLDPTTLSVTFALPVALPPPGTYVVEVGGSHALGRLQIDDRVSLRPLETNAEDVPGADGRVRLMFPTTAGD